MVISMMTSAAAAVFWGTAIMLVPEEQSTGSIYRHMWLPLCPLGLSLIAVYITASLQAITTDLQHLKQHMYNFKKA